VSPSNVAQARALLRETRRQQEEQRRLAWLAAKEGGSAAGTSRTNETGSWSTAEVEAEPEQEHADVVLPDFNAPVHGTGSVSASAENMQADYAKARAEIAVRRQRGAEERCQAWLAAKEGAYAAASEAKTRADTKAYAQAREQIQSIRRMEAKPKAFAAAGAAKAKADNAAYAKARADIQAIRQKDADARMRAFQEAKQGTGFATPPTPPPRDFSAPSRVQRVQIPAAAARAAAAAKARAELEVARQKAAEQRAHAFVQSCSERRSQAAGRTIRPIRVEAWC